MSFNRSFNQSHRKGDSRFNILKGKQLRCPQTQFANCVFCGLPVNLLLKCYRECNCCHKISHPSCGGNKYETDPLQAWFCVTCVDAAFKSTEQSYENMYKLLTYFVPRDKWGDTIYIQEITADISSVMNRNYKMRRQGYTFFRDGKIEGFLSSKLQHYVFLLAKSDDSQHVLCSFKQFNSLYFFHWCKCSCPESRAKDLCKHITATFFQLQDYILLGYKCFSTRPQAASAGQETEQDELELAQVQVAPQGDAGPAPIDIASLILPPDGDVNYSNRPSEMEAKYPGICELIRRNTTVRFDEPIVHYRDTLAPGVRANLERPVYDDSENIFKDSTNQPH